MAPLRQDQPKRFRVRGVAGDGLTVTLGRYDTEEQAQADCERLTREGAYRDVRVDLIPPRPDAPAPAVS
jgi:hypothetical protein